MRRSLLAGVAVSLVLVGILVTLLMPRPSRVNRANYDRVKWGMSQAQVEDILGGPPGDYRDWPRDRLRRDVVREVDPTARPFLPKRGESWRGDEGDIHVWFREGAVCAKAFAPAEVAGGPLDTLRWRLQRRWGRLWGGGP